LEWPCYSLASHALEVMYDAVVVGLGGVGSFALRNLAKQGKGGKFLGIERFKRGHEKGSSHGKTRIYRRAYWEHPNYVPWIEHSLKEFRSLEKASGKDLMQECGALVMDTAPNSDQLPPLVQDCYRSAQEHNIPVEILELENLQERFPQFRYDYNNMVGIYEPHAGILRPERIMEAALAEAEAEGGVEITENAWVAEIRDLSEEGGTRGPVELVIKTDDGEERHIQTRSLLVSAGAWTGQLIPAWKPHLNVTRQIQGWIDVSQIEGDPALFSSDNMPAWVMETPDCPLPVYGLPCDSAHSEYKNLLKVGIHCRSVRVLDLANNPSTASAMEIAELQLATACGLSEAGWKSPQYDLPNYAELQPCLYTMTADTHYMIGKPAGYQSVFCVAGLSGHGFKNTPALGQMMADFALGNDTTKWKMDFCSPTRFGV
jgi:sarcosine oxidase